MSFKRLAVLMVMATLRATSPAQFQTGFVAVVGTIRTASGTPINGALVRIGTSHTLSGLNGEYQLTIAPGAAAIAVSAMHHAAFAQSLVITADRTLDVTLGEGENVIVRSEEISQPDPAAQGFSRADLLEAAPGRPGVPFSVPGYPAETASGGIKAPQYFAPGVAGDHGEPVAQFFAVGGYLFQNNLTANAHGNGYADPNIVIASTIGGVLVDNAAYNARYGDHSINLAVTYDVQSQLTPYVQATTDGRDGSISAGWHPRSNSAKRQWLAVEALFGNGFLGRPEARQQYKLNGLHSQTAGRHELSLYGIGYYGFSRIPGLIPIDTPVTGDTIDLRQLDLTHTSLILFADRWAVTDHRMLTFGSAFRTYSLKLQSNFGDGLIRQSEFRTLESGNVTYSDTNQRRFQWVAGADARRDAPRGLNLAHADASGAFKQVTSNNLTIISTSPFAAFNARLGPHLQLYAGVRRDQIHFDNQDLLQPQNSFNSWPGTTSPKINLTLGSTDARLLPQVSFSAGTAFHANDPRIGNGSARGDLIVRATEYQLFATKNVLGNEVRLTLAHIANSAELAKIDPDTGLQQEVGPSLNRFLTLAIDRRRNWGFVQASWSAADARDRIDGTPIPEAPRTIVDAVAAVRGLPLKLSAKAEYEYVKAKPLGDGITGKPLQEIRLSLTKSIADGRWQFSADGQLNSGFTGQTLETLAVGKETNAFERRVGVPARSYAAITARYSFAR